MLKVTPKVKRRVAREWLVFLALIIVSPVLVGFIRWVNEDTTYALPKNATFKEQLSMDQDVYRVDDYIYHPENLKVNHLLTGPDKVYLDVPRRSFADYLFRKVKQPSIYLDVLYVYPIYLLVCSIIWAVTMLKRKEPV